MYTLMLDSNAFDYIHDNKLTDQNLIPIQTRITEKMMRMEREKRTVKTINRRE